ncbi:chemotaxis protein CheW [Synoicihabitans lomoniglobus]|uniref:Chemotaxis protein CheW n=1 Tax=Synoicihabitans lomoniglobus TaxID=2909285 RepID=A0AAF0I2S7_9BACT|nr:chemotaxis protein CheW [Opitutaceae bacterium LMO-M01]WED66702.1 chemotaxis protein CheW [Opitutaceae bacterium LMO-M01]
MSVPESSSRIQNLDTCWNRIGVRGDGSCVELEQHSHCRNCPVYSASAVKLLDVGLPADHLDHWGRHFAEALPERTTNSRSFMLFRIGPEWLALPTAVCREVTSGRAVHSLPHRRSGVVRGLINLHGALVVCVSLEAVLGLQPSGSRKSGSAGRMLVIGAAGQASLALAVDEVHGLHRCRSEDLVPAPATVSKATSAHVSAVLPWRERSVGCVDELRLWQTLDRSLA